MSDLRTDIPDAPGWAEAKQEALALANVHGDGLLLPPDRIADIAADVDVLMVVYPDEEEDDGLGMLFAKGHDRLVEISETGLAQVLEWTAVHAIDIFHAVGIQDALEADAARH